MFSQCCKLCCDGGNVPLYAGTGSRADGWKNKLQSPSGNLFGASNYICGGLRSQRAVSDADYILEGLYEIWFNLKSQEIAEASYMNDFLNMLYERYESVDDYFDVIGIDVSARDVIKKKMCGV